MDEQALKDKLRKIEALFAGAGTEGERAAAGNAIERIKAKMASCQVTDPPMEYKFTMNNMWSRRLLVALLRRYGIKPYRRYRQRRTTVLAMVSRTFVEETLWPEFQKLNSVLVEYIDDVTTRVIGDAVFQDSSEAEEIKGIG
ncbi:MAG: hypothetical protein Q9M09_04900 [Mariprofundaceae bacterium]|nr:hypothetical protein [Mariprofundaceae bacterium]